MGADQAQTLKAIREAEAYPGPSLVIAYAPVSYTHLYDRIISLPNTNSPMEENLRIQKNNRHYES